MPRRLPPLNAVRAFEAAARLGSFSAAATELHVTPAAVSHQIKGLEDRLGRPLFQRRGRRVRPTDLAARLLPEVSDSLDRIAAAFARLAAPAGDGTLTVTVGPAFAATWLVPRLEDFQERHPEIQVMVSASLDLVDLRGGGADVAIRFGAGRYPGLRVDRLFADSESLVPLCSPRLLDGPMPLREPADLAHQVLLHDESTRFDPSVPSWREWLKAAGVTGVDATRGPRFSNADHALRAAADGLGVLLGRTRLARRDLESGALVAPFPLRLMLGMGFYLVYPEERADEPVIAAFREWILDQAAREDAADGG
ncbi:MAG: transcriptional regulator GcvA [Rhodobacterales bacterium]|nr:transcriptional regulator GcvA [Rhodobacterales bacterium]